MHNHSSNSLDSVADAEDSILAAIGAGLDGIVFTEHDSYEASGHVGPLREKYRGRLLIFRGAEYSAEEGHLLLFGIRDDSFRKYGHHAPARDIIRVVTEAGGVVAVPHAFREWLLMKADITELVQWGITAIESCNGHTSHGDNDKALRAAVALGLPTTGGSDSHNHIEVGTCYTEFFERVTEENFIEVLRRGRYRGAYRVQKVEKTAE